MTGTMTIRIDEELRAYIDPLTPDEYAALEQSLLAEGCRDALVLWATCWSTATTATPFAASTVSLSIRCRTRACSPWTMYGYG